MPLTRRQMIAGLASGTALALVGGVFGFAGPAQAQDAETVDMGELMQPGPFEERTLGDPEAPVTIVEYASMTCSHCAAFHEQTFPKLKEQYIDTGKVYFVFREFPLDPVATAAFMLAHCVGQDKYFPFVDALFANQRTWAFGDNPEKGLFDMARQAGFDREKFEACLTNQDILNGVNAVKQRAIEEFDVRSTPTFFVDGEIVRGAMPFEQFEEVVQKHMPA